MGKQSDGGHEIRLQLMSVLVCACALSITCACCEQAHTHTHTHTRIHKSQVVADGRLHEKEGLRARVRELAAKRGVCLAFIAIDAQAATNTATAEQASGVGGSDKMDTDENAQGVEKADSGAQQQQGSVGASRKRGDAAGKASGGEQGGSSLLDMQTVSFVGGKPVFRKYMDDFPFPYYVLLRDIGALPRTLADMLRQWFEMSASS